MFIFVQKLKSTVLLKKKKKRILQKIKFLPIQFHVWFGLINIKIIQILSRHICRHCICKFLFFFKWKTDFLIICFKDKLLRLFCPPPPSKIIFTRFVYIHVKSQIAISWYFCCFNKQMLCMWTVFYRQIKKHLIIYDYRTYLSPNFVTFTPSECRLLLETMSVVYHASPYLSAFRNFSTIITRT